MFFQVEAVMESSERWFLSAAHHFPWTYAFREENMALLNLNLFCLGPPARNSNKTCQIVTMAGFLSVQWCGFSCLHICGFVCLVPRLALCSTAGGSAFASPNYRERITRVIAVSKRGTNICLSWQQDCSHKQAMQQAVTSPAFCIILLL